MICAFDFSEIGDYRHTQRQRERKRERKIEGERKQGGVGDLCYLCLEGILTTEDSWKGVSFIGEYMEHSRKLHLLLIFHHVGFIF